jgi:chemotaxis protein methyltransferase CheR
VCGFDPLHRHHFKPAVLSSQQFDRTKRLALSLAGIELVERHRVLLDRRSRRLGIPDSAGLDLLLNAVERGEATARRKLLCLLTTKFTGFFRHPRQFDLAAEHALQVVRHVGRARLWSAAAATGEEPYSLAMALTEVSGCDSPPASILATDVDLEALAVAQRGEYGEAVLRALEPARRKRFLCEAGVSRCWAIDPAVRRLVEFRPLNLVEAAWPVAGPFDVIFCRNVLMYLESRHRCAVLERLASLLAPEGLLMIDPTEHLGKAGHLFTPEADAVYRCRGAFCPQRNAI